MARRSDWMVPVAVGIGVIGAAALIYYAFKTQAGHPAPTLRCNTLYQVILGSYPDFVTAEAARVALPLSAVLGKAPTIERGIDNQYYVTNENMPAVCFAPTATKA